MDIHELIRAYNKTRGHTDKSIVCHAPFTSINFEQNGNMTACCYNRSQVLGTFPAQSIAEAWTGAAAEELRDHLRRESFEAGCKMCRLQLQSENFHGFKARLYDEYASPLRSVLSKLGISKSYRGNFMPRVFEFEIENTCNLECIMCTGYFSSSIRKNREKLPPVKSPYNKDFVQQVEAFIPHLTDMKFLGGEPFMIDLYHDIWESVARINPKIKINITTNATLLNNRTKDLLEGIHCGINISIDSIEKSTYERIRKNAVFERVWENVAWLKALTERKKTYLTFSVCPMVINWKEMPDIVAYGNRNNILVFFNTVWWPEEQSLRFLDVAQLDEIIRYYELNHPPNGTGTTGINHGYFQGLLNQLKFWKKEKEIPDSYEVIPDEVEQIFERIEAAKSGTSNPMIRSIMDAAGIKDHEKSRASLSEIKSNAQADVFLPAYFEALRLIYRQTFSGPEQSEMEDKINRILETVMPLKEKDLVVADLCRTGFRYQMNFLCHEPTESVIQSIRSRYH